MEFKILQSSTHELVVVAHDEDFQACVAIHSTKLGPALGGLRLRHYETPTDMVVDALNLSEGMSYKNAAAGLPFGGGKSTVNAVEWTEEISEKFNKVLRYVNLECAVGYVTAPDMNTTNDNMLDLEYAFYDSNGGDCSEATAYGVYQSLLAVESFTGKPMTVNIEGIGKVGKHLIRFCKEAGWDVCIADLDFEYACGMAGYYGTAAARVEDIKYLEGVYVPCAVGGTVTPEFVEDTEAWAVCGAANNQLSKLDVGKLLASRNILYVPDFIANAGGVISVGVAINGTTAEGFGLDNPHVKERVEFIRKQASALLLAQTTQVETRNAQLLAMKVAKEIIENA